MHIEQLLIALGLITFASIVIMYASNTFESASNYLWHNLAPGIKGATINAGAEQQETLRKVVAFLIKETVAGL